VALSNITVDATPLDASRLFLHWHIRTRKANVLMAQPIKCDAGMSADFGSERVLCVGLRAG
jgi:hypothetical protein